MGRNKGRQSRQLWDGAGGGGGGGGGAGKGSSLESYVRGQQLLLRGGSSGGSARASGPASRPVLDVARFQRILTSETRDQHDRHIQLATPFLELSQSHAEALRTRRRLEESRESDEGLYRELDRTVSPVRPLEDLCLRVLARHAASLSQDARREIEALPHATLSRFSLHASRSGTLSQPLLDWLCCAVRPGPTELCIGVGIGAGAGATAQQQLCPRRALLAKPEAAAAAAAAPRSAGAYVDNWEELDLDQPGALPLGRALLLQQQPLAGSLLRLHLVGLALPGHHALGAVLARSCVSLQHLTLHRVHIAGGGLERWFTDLLLPPRQWAADSPSSSTSSSSSSSSSTSTSSAFAPSQMADEGGPAWPALSTLHVSFCLDAACATRALEHLSLELFVQRRAQARTPVLAALGGSGSGHRVRNCRWTCSW